MRIMSGAYRTPSLALRGLAVLGLLVATLSPAASAQTVQRCESRDGKVTYSNTKCPEGTSAVRSVNTSPPVAVDEQKAAKERAKRDAAEAKVPRPVAPEGRSEGRARSGGPEEGRGQGATALRAGSSRPGARAHRSRKPDAAECGHHRRSAESRQGTEPPRGGGRQGLPGLSPALRRQRAVAVPRPAAPARGFRLRRIRADRRR